MKDSASDASGKVPIGVLVVDNHAITRKGIRTVLEPVAALELGGELESSPHAISQDRALQPVAS